TINGVLDKFVGDKMNEKDKIILSNEMKLAIIKDVQKHEESLVALQTYKSGSKIVDGIRAMVRPVIAFFFLFLFVADKFGMLEVALTDFDRTVFTSIIGFYFLLRHREKIKHIT
ncbi:unnamed protein product, partial [marine sediment metagenome]